jgi:two-component system, cell cycle sensor histidine kinase and response regulator CckA
VVDAAPPIPDKPAVKTILFVDDEAGLRSLIREILEDACYLVLEAKSGTEALEIWQTHRGQVDLLLTDLVMPGGIHGDVLARQMLQDNPGLKVILTSGSILDCNLNERLVKSEFYFLPKPYQPDGLLDAIQQCLNG